MECVPAYRLMEHTLTLTREKAMRGLDGLSKGHKHVRYMWVPYEDCVVVVTNDVEDEVSEALVERMGEG